MIEKQGKLFIDGVEQAHRYDRNERYGVDLERSVPSRIVVTFFEILGEISLFGVKLTVSRKQEKEVPRDCISIAFDPENKANG